MASLRTHAPRALAAGACAVLALLTAGPVARGDLSGSITSKRSAAQELSAAIAADSARIQATSAGLGQAQARLSAVDAQLATRQAQLAAVQRALLAARNHLVEVENRLASATHALGANLVATYEGGSPDWMTAVLGAHGFADLIDRFEFLKRVASYDANVVNDARAARAAVARQATALGALELRDQALTAAVQAQAIQTEALRAALAGRQLAELAARARSAAQLHRVRSQLATLQAQAAKAAAAAASPVGGIRVDIGGMVQLPPGAPAAIAQVIAAGNAIATLPYVWGGGHDSFQANGYDCSGSVSYALAAAGLLTSPLTSGAFESWGQPGPGNWITVYANAGHAFMVVAGWRFDTVALASGGTRWSRDATDTSGFVARHPPGL